MEQIAENRCFGGRQLRFRHDSDVLNCEMIFAVYLPPQAAQGKYLDAPDCDLPAADKEAPKTATIKKNIPPINFTAPSSQ